MAEPTSGAAAVVLTGAGLTVFGVATGLHPALLLVGLAGGWWVLSYGEAPMGVLQRLSILVLSALVAAWVAPAVAMLAVAAGRGLLPWWPQPLTAEIVQFPVALTLGLIAHQVLGRALLRLVARRAEDLAK